MIICHCHKVTDKDIRKNIKDGARSLKDISCICQACTDCKGCAKAIQCILKEELSK